MKKRREASVFLYPFSFSCVKTHIHIVKKVRQLNIQEYYRKQFRWQLAGGAALLVLGGAAVGAGYKGLYMDNPWMVGFPFFFYGVFLLISSSINRRRFRDVHLVEREGKASVSEVGTVVLLQLPSPVLHLLCFDESGVLAGEIKSRHRTFLPWVLPGAIINVLPKEWALYDAQGRMLAKYRQRLGLNPPFVAYDASERAIGEFRARLWGGLLRIKGDVTDGEGNRLASIDVPGSLYDYHITDTEGCRWFRFRKGWMPLAMGEKFKESESPLVSFYPDLPEEKRYLSLGIIAYFLASSRKE